MLYQLTMSGVTGVGPLSVTEDNDFTTLDRFFAQKGVLVIEAPIATPSSTTEPNIVDIGLYSGLAFDASASAGELVWASNSGIHAVYPTLSGQVPENIPVVDETFQLNRPSQLDDAGTGYTFDIDIESAVQSGSDYFVNKSGNLLLSPILAGDVEIDFFSNGMELAGKATFFGLDIGDDEIFRVDASFFGRVFDGLEYVASYPDLIAAFGVNREAGVQHFLQAGRTEGRVSTFDGDQYIASHDDLIVAFGANRDLGAQHFIAFGAAEGRPADDFNASQYLENYADLQAAFGGDESAATLHYITNGFFEGRTDDLLIG